MNLVTEFVNRELELANGCTEPAAVAYAVSSAAKYSDGDLKKIIIEMDDFVYKNGMTTGIPGIDDYRGNKTAAALGYYAENPERKKLKLLASDSKKYIDRAVGIMDKIKFKIINRPTPYIHVILKADNVTESLITNEHSNLKWIKVNGKKIKKIVDNKDNKSNKQNNKSAQKLNNITIEQIVDIVEKQYNNEIKNVLKEGLHRNMALVKAGQRGEGNGIGLKYEKIADNKIKKIGSIIAHGVDARMAGVPLPAMASSGSGDQGITISISINEMGKLMGKDEDEIFRATLIGHMTAYYIKLFMGRLSSYCGLITAAAPGILAALLYMDGMVEKIEDSINYMLGDSSGILCDGANASCALKAVSAFELAFRHYQLAKAGLSFDHAVGIMSNNLEETLKNLNKLSSPAEDSLNETLVEVLESNNN
ncbi:MAG: L-serine ammonia-lyase, iron-sulfur-dependent, subunit alpha [Halanaerobiales bacterium]